MDWSTIRPGNQQYTGWEHWFNLTTNSEINAGLAAIPDRPMMSEDRFRLRSTLHKTGKDLPNESAILTEIPRWAGRGVGAIYAGLSRCAKATREIKHLLTSSEHEA
jgi:hypothetical protein